MTGVRTVRGRKARRAEALRREKLLTAALRRETKTAITSVRFARPWWMPPPLYRWLIASIIVHEVVPDAETPTAARRVR